MAISGTHLSGTSKNLKTFQDSSDSCGGELTIRRDVLVLKLRFEPRRYQEDDGTNNALLVRVYGEKLGLVAVESDRINPM